MAKMFYTLDETKAALGQTEDEIKQLAKEGRLREFRDGNRVMFKGDQVESLKKELASSGDAISLSDEPIGLADSKDPSSSASGISLADSGGTGFGMTPVGSKAGTSVGSKAGTKAGSSAGTNPSDDTALAADLGLSGSVSGIPSSGRVSAGASGTRSGIDIFGADETEKADPSAQTSIAPGLNSEINIESVGSGSGLLDLTRESDDTSLGAELMDEIAPGASGVRRTPGESALSASALGGSSLGGSGPGVSMGDLPSASAARQAPAIIEAPDPLAPAFGMAAIGAAGVILFASFAIMCGLAGTHPDVLKKFGSSAEGGFGFLVVLGICLALPIILFAVGFATAKMGRK